MSTGTTTGVWNSISCVAFQLSRYLECSVSGSRHVCLAQCCVSSIQMKFSVFSTRRWTADVLRHRVNMAEPKSPAVVKRCVLCQGSVVCFFPVCCKGPLCVRGEPAEWRSWDPLHSWEETPPIESTEAECAGLNETGAKGFVSGSLPSSSPRIPGNQVWLLGPACREKTTQRRLYFSSGVQHHGSLWEQRWLRMCGPVWS